MPRILLDVPSDMYAAISAHLLPPGGDSEEVAFAFVHHRDGTDHIFGAIDWYPVPPEGFVSRSAYYVELTDATRAHVIKWAHELGASLVELHSHLGPYPARFSPSDRAGFEEFVPHVFWRLKRRPYLAIVVADTGFDGFAWLDDPQEPARLDGIVTGGALLEPTRLSPLDGRWHDDD